MTARFSQAVVNAVLETAESTVGTAPLLILYAGVKPTNTTDPDPAGILVTFVLPADWLTTSTQGQKQLSITLQAIASGTGIAQSFRIKDSLGIATSYQGTVTLRGAGGDLTLSSTNIRAGQKVKISTFKISATRLAALTQFQAAQTLVASGNVSSSPPAGGDFTTRRAGAGVVRWHKFNSGSTVAEFDNTPIAGQSSLGPGPADPTTGAYGWVRNVGASPLRDPVIDTSVKPSGSGSMRIDLIDGSLGDNGTQSPGRFVMLMPPVGAGQKVFIQWRQRVNQDWIDTIILDSLGNQQNGIKQVTATSNYPPGIGMHQANSCQLVSATHNQYRFLEVFCDDLGGASLALSADDPVYGGQDLWQNGQAGCTRHDAIALGSLPPGCFTYVADEWMTYELEINLVNTVAPVDSGTNGRWVYPNSEMRLWGARENQAPKLLVDWKPSTLGYRPLDCGEPVDSTEAALLKYAKVWFNPQMTGASSTQVHPIMKVWFDEIIISSQFVAFPSLVPAWRSAITTQNVFSPIPNTSVLGGGQWWNPPFQIPPFGSRTQRYITNGYSGFVSDGTKLYSMAAAGHDGWQNVLLSVDLIQPSPLWAAQNPCSVFATAGVTTTGPGSGPYYPGDGRPVGCQNYWDHAYIDAAHSRDGVASLMRFGDVFPFMSVSNPGGEYRGGPKVNRFNLTGANANLWDSQVEFTNSQTLGSSWADLPSYTIDTLNSQPWSVSQHPTTQIVYLVWNGSLVYWLPSTGVASTGTVSGSLKFWETYPSLVDVNATRSTNGIIVCLLTNTQVAAPTLCRLALPSTPGGTYTVLSEIPLTGAAVPPIPGGDTHGPFYTAGMVHDLDNDRYIVMTGGSTGYEAYAINPTSGATTHLQTLTYLALDATGVFSKIFYVSSLGGVVFIKEYDDNLQFMPTR